MSCDFEPAYLLASLVVKLSPSKILKPAVLASILDACTDPCTYGSYQRSALQKPASFFERQFLWVAARPVAIVTLVGGCSPGTVTHRHIDCLHVHVSAETCIDWYLAA